MPQSTVESTTLEDLKRQAVERAENLGHRLEPFRAAKRDPSCYVSFCNQCRQVVIVSLEERPADDQRALYGYALEARCVAHPDDSHHALASAQSR